MNGIQYIVPEAIIMDCGSFQSESGEPIAFAKMGWMGGNASLNISPSDLSRVLPFKGKMVTVSGGLTYEIKKGGRESAATQKTSNLKEKLILFVGK